ncbi:MAG: hypothetical protein GXO70_02570, partial [Acidobacteria bacterium]|nr:hypothetical protein [Acidobacteriota bacterium]
LLTIAGFAADGFQATYSVKVTSGSSHEYQEVITICGDSMRIQLSADRFLLFDKKKGLAWKVNTRSNEAVAYTFNDNQPFYQQFLIAYGLMDNRGQLIFPQVIFKRTGNRKVVQNVPCFEAKLPGEFMNSTTTVWMPEKAVKRGGERFFQFMSFFTGNGDFLDLIRHATGFPRRIISRVQLNSSVTVNRQTLLQIVNVPCEAVFFKLPKELRVHKAQPSGVPLRSF